MEIGLLLCDRVNLEFIEIDGTYLDMFQKLIPTATFIPYHVYKGDFPKSSETHRVWMVSGSRYSAYDNLDWINQVKTFIQSIASGSTKFIGTCFGHQLLAAALGGKVEKANSGWEVGVKKFDIHDHHEWMQPEALYFNMLMMCQDQVTRLPTSAKRLASSPTCENGMFIVDNRLLGIQGHPEFSKAYDRTLMETRIDRIGEQVVHTGIKSLETSVDSVLIAQWITNFCNS